MRHKIKLVVRPTGVYQSFPVKGFDWLTAPFIATRFRQSRPDLANGPMERWSAHTGPEQLSVGAPNA
jgi:hypothetical protein